MCQYVVQQGLVVPRPAFTGCPEPQTRHLVVIQRQIVLLRLRQLFEVALHYLETLYATEHALVVLYYEHFLFKVPFYGDR